MEEDYDYVELHVTNVRKVESDRRRCIVSMQPNNDVREFMFFTDEYNAARIALRAFPEKSQMINTTLWSELTINALSAFDVTVKNVTVIRGKDEIFRSILAMYNSDTGINVNISANVPDEVMIALSSNIPVRMGRKLFEDVSGINDNGNKVKIPLSLLPRNIIENRLAKAVENENYELASLLRDELKRRDTQE